MSEFFPETYDGAGNSPARRAKTELVEYRDRVLRAASIICLHDLAIWFEPDWGVAQQVSAICPWCAVYSVPPEAVLMHDLSEPPPWRRRAADAGGV